MSISRPPSQRHALGQLIAAWGALIGLGHGQGTFGPVSTRGPARGHSRGTLGEFLSCLVFLLAACSAAPHPASSSTLASTTPAPPATPALPRGVTRLPPVGMGLVQSSPDGALIAIVSPAATLTVYTISGLMRGRFVVRPEHQVYSAGWLRDSTGLFVADIDPGASASAPPLLLMTPDGATKPTGLDAGAGAIGTVVVSPDNQWIADAAPACTTCGTQVEVAPRSGGTKRVLPPATAKDNVWVLGWQSSRLIYYDYDQNTIYAFNPQDGSRRFLTLGLPSTSDGSDTFRNPLYYDAGPSPDGQALSVATSHGGGWVLTGSHLQQDPPAIAGEPIYWIGQGHASLGSIHERIATVDVLSGTVLHDSGIAGSDVLAVAGNWAVITVIDGGLHFHVINYVTGVDHPLDGFGGDVVYGLGSSRFLFQQTQAPQDTYIIDATSLAG